MTTPNLGLTSTTSAAGSAVKFLDWRLGIDGDTSSNMIKIDTWAGQTNGSIIALKGGVTYSGSAVSGDGLGYTAVISGSPAYTLGTILFLKVDTTNTGTIGLNINTLGSKNVYKVNKNGIASNVSAGDIIANTYNTFIFTANDYWMWIGTTSSDQIAISGSTNEIVILSGSGITNSGVLISSLVPTAGSYVVLSLNPNLSSEWLFSSGSGATLVTNSSASTVRIDVGAVSPLTVASGSMTLPISTPLVTTSGSLGLSVNAPIVTTSGSVGLATSAPIVISSGSVTLATSAPIVISSGSVTLATSAPIVVSSGSVTLAVNAPIVTTSGSVGIAVNAPIVTTSGSIGLAINSTLTTSSGSLTLATTGVAAGSYVSVQVDTYGRVISASSTHTRIAIIPLNASTALSGSEVGYIRIPSNMNGWYLTDAAASCSASSTSGSPVFSIGRISASSVDSGSVVMLSTYLSIDQGEYDSSNASASRVISTSASTVYTGDKVKALCINSGASVTYAEVSVSFTGI